MAIASTVAAGPALQGAYRIVEPFPNWWGLQFRRLDSETGKLELKNIDSRGVGFTEEPEPPIDPVKPISGPVSTYRFDSVHLDDGYGIIVYLITWPEPWSRPGNIAMRLKVHLEPTNRLGETGWRLERIFLPSVQIRNTNPENTWQEDVGVIPSFREFRFVPGSPLSDRLVDDLWTRRKFQYLHVYPGDWYLPFWAVYNARKRQTFWMMLDDHQIDPFTCRHKGWAVSYIRLERIKEENGKKKGGDPGVIRSRFSHAPRTDNTPLTGPARILPYTPTGNVLVEELTGEAFKDYYDLLRHYRQLVDASPVVQVRSNPDHPRYRPVPDVYRDLPLMLAPQGEWKRYAQVPATGDLRLRHVEDLKRTFGEMTAGTRHERTPGLYFHGSEHQWDGSVFPKAGVHGPSLYRRIRPKYRSLLQWRKRLLNRGLVAGYVAPGYAPPESPDADPDAWILSPHTGKREEGKFCWGSQAMKRIIRDTILNGALGPNVALDGLHLDTVWLDPRCADPNHGHPSDGSNESIEGVRETMALLHRVKENFFLDVEVPGECNMDIFDSSWGEMFHAPETPPFFRMIYGNIIQYTHAMIHRGYNPQWGDYPLFDLYNMLPLKDGGIPVVVIMDTPGAFTANRDPDEPVKKLLRSYILNYDRLLKPAFQGDVVRMPEIEAPWCGVTAVREMPPGSNREIILNYKYPVVRGTAYARKSAQGRCASIVLLNWATTYENPYSTTSSLTIEYRRAPRLLREMVGIYFNRHAAAFQASHTIEVTIDPIQLALPQDIKYTIFAFYLKNEESPSCTVKHIGELSGRSRKRISLNMPASSIMVIKIDPTL